MTHANKKSTCKKTDLFPVLIWIVALQLIGYSMGRLTGANLHPWYASLTKSLLTPPDITFAIIWPMLYILLAIVGANLFFKKNLFSTEQQTLFGAQLILNWLWSPVFFGLHWVAIAFIILNCMVMLTTVLIYTLYGQHKKLALLLMPYLIWIIFASYLNGVIWFAS